MGSAAPFQLSLISVEMQIYFIYESSLAAAINHFNSVTHKQILLSNF